ncbi:hypothetical protein IKQ_05984 [Bacillus cereus VDM053]|nr:hypothetical protein IKQ_05984 [Bacillus cereus VDM053]
MNNLQSKQELIIEESVELLKALANSSRIQITLAFGEEFHPKLHQLYHSISKEELPTTSDGKVQDFIYNTSKVAKQNSLPFFDKWGLMASSETRKKIEAMNYPALTTPIWESTDSKPVKPLAVRLMIIPIQFGIVNGVHRTNIRPI